MKPHQRHHDEVDSPPPPQEPRQPPQSTDRKERASRHADVAPDDHEGATEDEVGDRGGPGAGFDESPEQDPDRGGVAES